VSAAAGSVEIEAVRKQTVASGDLWPNRDRKVAAANDRSSEVRQRGWRQGQVAPDGKPAVLSPSGRVARTQSIIKFIARARGAQARVAKRDLDTF
jgi:hypothetical protein